MPADPFDSIVPPRNLEAERAVLGAMVLDNEVIDDVVGIVRAEDFFDPRHRILFQTIINLRDRFQAVDILTLKNDLEREDEQDEYGKSKKNLLEQSGGAGYLAEVLDSSPHAANAVQHAKIVCDQALLRRIISAGASMVEAAKNPPGSADDVLELAEKAVLELSRKQEGEIVKVEDVAYAIFRELERIRETGEYRTGLMTGARFQSLDKITNGFLPGHLIILAARPGIGKTTLGLNFIQEISVTYRHPAAIFSLEMNNEALVERLLADRSKVNATRITRGELTEEELSKIHEATGAIFDAPIFIDDSGYLTPMDIRRKARRLKNQHNIELIIIDYLQLMSSSGTSVSSRQEEIASISRSLKSLAKELQIPVVAMAQLRRTAEEREERGPRLSDLRESGAIEQDADIVMLLWRQRFQLDDQVDRSRFIVNVAKNRHGQTGHVNLHFVTDHLSFEEMAEEFVDDSEPYF
ncbi:MAG: replicative DNA helicase [Planctomycetota bacterium]|jgi:replicative DNA helicase